MSDVPIVGSFMIGNKIFDAEVLFKSLRLLGLNIEATPEGIEVNGVLIKPNAVLDENVCPLAKVCERRAYFLELIQKKTRNLDMMNHKQVNRDLDLFFKTLDNNSQFDVFNEEVENSLNVFGIKVGDDPDTNMNELSLEKQTLNSNPPKQLNHWRINNNSDNRRRSNYEDDEVVKKALKQIFSPVNREVMTPSSSSQMLDSYYTREGLTKVCPSCGELLAKEWNVCPRCGHIF